MKLTNKEMQKELDFQKWNLSQVEKKDLSGQMEYCSFCPFQIDKAKCDCPQAMREEETLCAKAFNRMKKAEKVRG